MLDFTSDLVDVLDFKTSPVFFFIFFPLLFWALNAANEQPNTMLKFNSYFKCRDLFIIETPL